MFGWAVGFFVAAVIAAMFGFGVIASTFAGIAMILFYIFVALLALSLIMSLFTGRSLHVAGEGHARARGPNFGAIGAIALTAVVAIAAYAWVQNDWSAERAGRVIDRNAAEITADASDVLENAGDRAGNLIQATGLEMREDAAQGLDRAQETVDSDNRNETTQN